MSRRLLFSERAQDDLDGVFAWIADRAGIAVARSYGGRIENHCRGFAQFPERGRKRDDLAAGLRVVGFERRVAIAYAIIEDTS